MTMTVDDRVAAFERAIKTSPIIGNSPNKWKIYSGRGASNHPMVVEQGLEVCSPDLDAIRQDSSDFESTWAGFVFWGAVGVPPGDQLFVAVFVRAERGIVIERLNKMLQPSHEPDVPHRSKNNNVPILARQADRRIYLRNQDHWVASSLDIDMSAYGPSFVADRVEYAVYRRNRGEPSSLAVGAYIAYLSSLFPPRSVHEIHPWVERHGEGTKYAADPSRLKAEDLHAAISGLGGYYTLEVVRDFHAALNHLKHKHIVILAGPSGFGKTGLAIRYAQAVHGLSAPEEDDPFLFVCAVKPDWTDPSGLLGYYDVVLQRYVSPPFLQAILSASANPDIPVFVCIDELNIARVEYYFADILSAVESRRSVTLHSNPQGYEGTNGETIPHEIALPTNLYIVGTINVDETTHRISDKVLDRVNTIALHGADANGFLARLRSQDPGLETAIDMAGGVLSKVASILEAGESPVGYRVIEEFARYLKFCLDSGSVDASSVIDSQMLQKILVKLHGSTRHESMLRSLADALATYPRSQQRVRAMQRDLDEFGTF